MSPLSNSDRPYKSQVLNFVNRLFLRLGDRAQISLRQLKTATVWGVQIIAYPLYLLVQTSTLLGKRVQLKAVELLSPSKKNTSSVASQPTAVVLNSIHPWLENTPYQLLPLPKPRGSVWEKIQFWRRNQPHRKQTQVNRPSPSPKPGILSKIPFLPRNQGNPLKGRTTETYLIQGIATYVETGKLVLVTTENQAIDLLSDTQHEQLKQRIKILLECYEQMQQPWWWRIASQRHKGRFNPLRWLSQLMIWIQTSPLAKRLNWFRESQLSFSSTYSQISQTPPFQKKQGFLDQLDRALSRWEKTQLSPAIKKIKHWRENLDQQENPISSLIRSAVDYFYGVKPQKSLKGEETTNSNQPKKNRSLLQPLSNLVQQRVFNRSTASKSARNALAGENTQPFSITQLIQAAIDYFFGKPNHHFSSSSHTVEASRSHSEPWLTKADLFGGSESRQQLGSVTESKEDFSLTVAHQLSRHVSSSAKDDSQETESETASDGLQAEAIPMGYEKHFLARILEWLDRALAWLEGKLLQLWRWLRQL